MMKIKFVLCLVICLGLYDLRTCAQEFTMNQGKLLNKDISLVIPMPNTVDEIKTKCIIGNRSVQMILDIGAPLCISKQMQNELHFPILLSSSISDSGNNKDSVRIVLVDTIRFEGLTFVGIPAVVLDFENSPIACEHIDGLLGSNVFRFLSIQFDASSRSVRITDNIKTLIAKTKPNGKLILDSQSNAFAINRFNGNVIDTFHFDSGMNGFYDMQQSKVNELLQNQNSKTALIKRGEGSGSQGIFGKEQMAEKLMLSSDIHFGKYDFLSGVIHNANSMSRMGRELFNLGKLTLDYKNKVYYFEADEKKIQCYRNRDFGFKPILEDGKCLVALVWKGSQAEQLGLKTGDEILKINNINLKELDPCEKELVIKGALRKKYMDIDIMIGQKMKQLNLTAE